MATATEISSAALKRLRIVEAGGTPAAADTAEANLALDRMIASWETGWLSGDVTPFDARFEAGIIAMLAVRLAGDYGKPVDAVLADDARRGWNQIRAAFLATPEAQFDGALTLMPATRGLPYAQSVAVVPDWTTQTAYTGRQKVINARNLYELVTEGTSGTTGPTGTGSEITDGTCVWVWRGVVA